jgi:alpha-1,2-mannosyltransferase
VGRVPSGAGLDAGRGLTVPGRRQRILALVLLVVGVVVATWTVWGSGFTDLSVYVAGGRAILDGEPLYRATGDFGLPFTYTPFAALLFVPLALTGPVAPVLMLLASLAALVRVSFLLGRALAAAWDADLRACTVGLLGLMLVSEPVTATLAFGQVNILVLWLVVEAFGARRASGPWLIGIAAAIKLTPLAFVPLMLGSRRSRDGLVSLLAFAVTVLLGWLAQPGEATRYWSALAADARRVGGVAYVSNQSLNGMLWRLDGPGGNRAVWAVACVVVGLVCYVAGIRALRGGDWILAVGSVGLFSLLASPISWSHHWVLLAPMLVALCLLRTRTSISLAVLGVVVVTSRVIWWVPNTSDLEYGHRGWQIVAGNAYALFGLVVVVYLAARLLETRRSGPPQAAAPAAAPDLEGFRPRG